MTKLFTAFSMFVAAVAAAPAHAEPLAIDTAVVSIADLDLSTASGQRALNARISRAVVDLCGEAADVDLAGRNAVRACRNAKSAEAHAIGAQRLAQRSNGDIQLASR